MSTYGTGYGDHGFVAAWHDHRLLILGLAILVLGSLLIYSRSIQRTKYRQQPHLPLPGAPEKTLGDFEKAVRPKSGSYEEVKERGDVSRVVNDDQKNKIAVAPRPRLAPRRVRGSKIGRPLESPRSSEPKAGVLQYKIQPLVFFSSLTGNTEACARKLVTDLAASLNQAGTPSFAEPTLHDLSYVDYDDFFITPPTSEGDTRYVYLLLLPTYNIDTVLNNFLAHLQETHHDFRIDTAPLSGLLGYSVFGFGDREGWPTEEEGFCSQAKDVDKWLAKLTGGKRAFPLGMGDAKSDAQQRLDEWRQGVEEVLRTIRSTGNLGEGVLGSGDAIESDNEDDELDEQTSTRPAKPGVPRRKAQTTPKPSILEDLEDLGRKAPIPIDFTVERPSPTTSLAPKPMVPTTSPTYTALTKQGYTIIGSHSGVKICRWTKSALRGRGSCYKHSFYGIASHLCMETTPSLSCSNKCVFCWRHGTNPVGTTWRWQIDPPDMILEGAMAAHYQKIKMMRGVPGVQAERFQEAMRIRHCALSLVGEPIFYPHINEFVDLLHRQHISSFLVCNAQHPDQLAALKPVTQLYVSIDASNRDSLRKIDRPLHRDFWERFLRCLDILRERRFSMRTVFRLTLVKGFNIDDEVEGYADLVARGLPCFVEIKGVTYCGTSSSSSAGLTMQNVPFYTEVVAFVTALDKALEKRGLQYGIAAEHAHSCCVLLASKRFFIEGKWHTLIDYEAFFKCLEKGEDFRPEDYIGEPTPEWACWGRGGFDPTDQRVDRKGRPLVQELKVGLLEETGTVLEARDDDET